MKEKEKGEERDREGSRGDWSPGYGGIMETGGWRGSCLGGGWPLRVHCQVSKPRGRWSLPPSPRPADKYVVWQVCFPHNTNKSSDKEVLSREERA